MIVSLEMRRRAKAEGKFMEAFVLAQEMGAHHIAELVREGCALLQTPKPSGPGAVQQPPHAA